jgi:hypothetical protein
VSAREEIAAALSALDGIDVSPTYRNVSGPGQGYVEWLRTDYPNRLGGEDYWGVVITLPADLAAAQAWIAENKARLIKALDSELFLTQARPELVLATDNPSQRVLVLEGHRESEE